VEKHGTPRQATDDNIIRCVRILCWIIKATDTHSEYAILITFPRQQWLRERASVLLYTGTLPFLLDVKRVDGADIRHWALTLCPCSWTFTV